MLNLMDIVGTLTLDSIPDLVEEASPNSRILNAYRNYLEDSIENKFGVTCNISIADRGPLHFRVSDRVQDRVSETMLVDFERECRQSFLENKVVGLT
jgi:hypothetical protein